ncbi:MAG: hypothetical protein SFV17_27990 [Candidatus Obscuribacter sp.]|nr:hypothetical protein [Candidatus Obscuribacter sp.]
MITARELLRLFKVEPGIYQLGCTAKRLTIHSQLKRAFNLVWALHRTGTVNRNSSVGVIGAGFGGVAVACGCAALGAKVRLYEQALDILPLQQGSSTRFVHPNLYDWPDTGSMYPITHLPYFNWRSNYAGDVVREAMKQWRRLGKLVDSIFGIRIKSVRSAPNGIFVDSTDDRRFRHNVVVIAIGFGIESPKIRSGTSSYWRNDDTDQAIIGAKNKIKVIVSGTGDGGLIDAVRSTLKDFRHAEFTDWISLHSWFRQQGQLLRTQLDANSTGVTDVWNNFIENAVIPADVAQELKAKHRSDTTVLLSSRRLSALESDAALINKLAVATMIKLKQIGFISGELIDIQQSPAYAAVLRVGSATRIEPCDRLITRLGARSKVFSLLGARRFSKVESVWPEPDKDPTDTAQYEVGFLGDEFKKYNWETRFSIVFALGRAADGPPPSVNVQTPQGPLGVIQALPRNASRALATLRNLGRNLGVENLHANFVNQVMPIVHDYTWHRKGFRVALEGTVEGSPVVITPRGWRSGPFLRIETDSRQIVEMLLAGDGAAYHIFDYYVTDEATRISAESRDIETNVYLIDQRGSHGRIRMVSHKGMYQAHRILRVPALLEIMGNTWVLTAVHRIGWIIANKYTRNLSDWQSL